MKRLLILAIVFSCAATRVVFGQSTPFLVEVFRNVDCANCSGPDQDYEAFLKANPLINAHLVFIHNNFPAANDIFFLASSSDIKYRSDTWYKVIQDPTLFVSGINASSGQPSDEKDKWEPITTQAANTLSYPATLTVTPSVDNTGKLLVDLNIQGSTNGKKVIPYIILVESGIVFNNTQGYGNPTSGTWDNMFRAMIPKKDGDAAITVSGTKDLQYVYDPTGKPWNLANCQVIAILQLATARTSDGISHDILGFASAKITQSAVSESDNTGVSSLSAPVPNPSQSVARIPFHLANPGHVKIVICDDLGREISTILDEFVSEHQSSAIFMPSHLSGGIYYARMYTDGALNGMQKIVFAP